jgi:hypothetical protein
LFGFYFAMHFFMIDWLRCRRTIEGVLWALFLTFYRSWWAEQGFPVDVQVGEGEDFLAGREAEVLEIPPQQAIVAFSHGTNTSSRRIPSGAEVRPGCFWGFPKEFLMFIHGLAGVKVVEE